MHVYDGDLSITPKRSKLETITGDHHENLVSRSNQIHISFQAMQTSYSANSGHTFNISIDTGMNSIIEIIIIEFVKLPFEFIS